MKTSTMNFRHDDDEDRRTLRTYTVLLTLLLSALAINTCAHRHAHAQQSAAASDVEWTDSTRLALAQCFWAEAGPRNHTEHALMAYVLLRRWRAYNDAHAEPITFEQEIRQYCHVHRTARESSSNGWVLGLPWGPLEADPRLETDPRPMCVGDDCWRRYAGRWDDMRQSVEAFERGELRDPMPLAVLWGGAQDSGGSASSMVWLGPTVRSNSVVDEQGERAPVLLVNRFYARRSEVERAARRRGRSD